MTSYDWEIVGAVMCVSLMMGVLLGALVKRITILVIASIVLTALIFLATLGYRFGGPAMWPWQDSRVQDVIFFGPLLVAIAVPLIGAASFARRVMQRKVI